MNDSIEHYEAGMEEGEYLASETDIFCEGCNRPLLGWEVEEGRYECQRCLPPDYAPPREHDYSENPF